MFDVAHHLDELRTWPTERLVAQHEHFVREQRRLLLEEVRYGLHVHHLRPKSWGGSDDPSNLAVVSVADAHHPMLVPTGPWALVGNPNQPDGLELVHLDNLYHGQAQQLGLPPRRAGPDAA